MPDDDIAATKALFHSVHAEGIEYARVRHALTPVEAYFQARRFEQRHSAGRVRSAQLVESADAAIDLVYWSFVPRREMHLPRHIVEIVMNGKGLISTNPGFGLRFAQTALQLAQCDLVEHVYDEGLHTQAFNRLLVETDLGERRTDGFGPPAVLALGAMGYLNQPINFKVGRDPRLAPDGSIAAPLIDDVHRAVAPRGPHLPELPGVFI